MTAAPPPPSAPEAPVNEVSLPVKEANTDATATENNEQIQQVQEEHPVLSKIRTASEYKDSGNSFFQQGNLKKALAGYHKVQLYLKGLCESKVSTSDGNPKVVKKDLDKEYSSLVGVRMGNTGGGFGADMMGMMGAMGGNSTNGGDTEIPLSESRNVAILRASTWCNMANCYLKQRGEVEAEIVRRKKEEEGNKDDTAGSVTTASNSANAAASSEYSTKSLEELTALERRLCEKTIEVAIQSLSVIDVWELETVTVPQRDSGDSKESSNLPKIPVYSADKALIRLAQGYVYIGEVEKCEEYLVRLEEKKSMEGECKRLRSRIEVIKKKDDKKRKQCFGKMFK